MPLLLIESGRPRTTQFGGKSYGLALNTRTVYADYTIAPNDDVILADCTAGNIRVTVGPSSSSKEKFLLIKKTDSGSNTVIVDTLTETLDENITITLKKQYDGIFLVSTPSSSKWSVFGERFAANMARKIALPTPTASGWNIDPAPLAECVDDDYADFTTAGAITVASGWAYITMDLGETYVLAITAYAPATNYNAFNIEFSFDNSTWYTILSLADPISVAVVGVGRYVRIAFQNAGGGTLSLPQCSINAIGAPTA